MKNLNKIKGVTVKMTPRWDGRSMTTIIEIAGTRFKVNVGLANGGGNKRISILGTTGWEYFLTLGEIGFDYDAANKYAGYSDVSYVSNEQYRKPWAEYAMTQLVTETAIIFG